MNTAPRVHIRTYGCQMNERDSEAVAASLLDGGYRLTDSESAADVILLNTCSVRDQAEQKALGKMGLLTRLKRERPDLILGFLGCMAQARAEELLERIPEVDLVVGTQRFHRVARLLDEVRRGHRGIVDVNEDPPGQLRLTGHLSTTDRPCAFVSIMQGCDQFCAFCIVPHTRGRERSRSIEEIRREVAEVCAGGVREVTLLGQIVTSYGWREAGMTPRRGPGEGDASPFVRLLEALHEVPGLERIRFTAPHPAGVRDDLLEAIRDLPRVCEQLHLPAQSGSDAVLRRMRRGYTVDGYREIVARARAIVPGITLSTDMIAGFPGETDADADATVALVETVRFDHAFCFKYSPRRGTPAAAMDDPVPAATIVSRHRRLLAAVDRIGAERLATRVGKVEEVLVEGTSKRNHQRLSGRTRGNHTVLLSAESAAAGETVPVRIVRATEQALYGERVDRAAATEASLS